MSQGLAVSGVVNVSVQLSPVAAAVRNFGNLLIMGSSSIIDTSERMRLYTTLAGVAADFGTSAAEYVAASVFFGQSPAPSQVYIGRWAQAATAGLLHGGLLPAAEQLMSAWTSITTGALKITTDGVLRTLTAMDFSTCANMNAVAAVLNTKLGANGTCTWNAVYNRFEIVSPTTGAASTVTYAIASGTGVDMMNQFRLTAATGAPAPVDGIVAETLLTGVGILAAKSNDWYGLYCASASAIAADHVAVAGFIEAATLSRIYGVTSADANTLVASATSDLAYTLKAAGYSRTFTQYSSTALHAAVSIFGRTFTVDFNGSNTALTVKFKTEPGITPETLTETQAAAATAKNCNVYVNYDNSTAIVQQGVMASGKFFDEIHGTDWWQNDIQTEVYNLLYTSATKIPQTDAGVNQIVSAVSTSAERAVKNGLLAPGVWTGPDLGAIKSGQTLASGYYVYAPPISSQSSGARGARIAPTIQVAAKLAGAVHFANVIVNVNR